MIRAVIDTNVLVSGLLSPDGKAALILLAIDHGLVRVCLTNEIFEEYTAVLARPKFNFAPDVTAALFDTLRSHGDMVQPDRSATPPSPDPDDTRFLQCALAARADVIVTGNKRDFPDTPYGQTVVLGIGEFLERLTLEMRP